MARIQKLWLLLTIIGPFHMGEQLITDIEEYYSIRDVVSGYYSWFSAADADWATVVLITIVWSLCSLICYALLRGGRASLLVVGMFGLFGAQEFHHVVEAISKLAYDPGLISSIPYCLVGALLVSAVWREFRNMRRQSSGGARVQMAIA